MDKLLLETGGTDAILLETGGTDAILLESAVAGSAVPIFVHHLMQQGMA